MTEDVVKKIVSIQTNEGEIDVVGYSLLPDGEFCTHRNPDDATQWVVTHMRSGLRLPGAGFLFKSEAIEMAAKMSASCPSAKDVTFSGTIKDGKGVARGPVSKLHSEVKAVLAEMSK